jgi:hypothetical protein
MHVIRQLNNICCWLQYVFSKMSFFSSIHVGLEYGHHDVNLLQASVESYPWFHSTIAIHEVLHEKGHHKRETVNEQQVVNEW